MKSIYIIGAGPGNKELLTIEARNAIDSSDLIIAHGRLIKDYKDIGKKLFESTSPKAIADYIATFEDGKVISVLVSGDTGFYSLAKSLREALNGLGDIKIICGISSIQYFCSKIQSSWDDAILISLHGRENNIVEKVKRNNKTLLITDSKHTPTWIIELLCENNLEEVVVTIGENLSYENEKITKGSAKDLKGIVFESLSVMQIENKNSKKHIFLNDDMFIRSSTPMTKQEIRCISINKLQLQENDIVFDIGAGTGSVSIEMSLQIPDGKVYAIEKETEAVELINENRQNLSVSNLDIIKGNAKDVILDLPTPQKVFIGGSSGEINDILNIVYDKNPNARIVINAITLETLCEVTNYYKNKSDYLFEVVNVSVSYTRKLGNYNLFTGQNPVYIITISRKD